MEERIKEALKQMYKHLGLSDEAFDGVAAFGKTIVTDEQGIDAFVKGAEPMLKSIQSSADKMRTENSALKKQIEELKSKQEPAKQPEPAGQEPDKNEPDSKIDMNSLASIIAKSTSEAVASAVKPLQDRLDAIDAKEKIGALVSNAKAKFDSNDYVKEYKDEATEAWERAVELNEASGNKLSEQELHDKAMGYFNKAVSKRGVDTTKPFESKGGSGDPTPNFAEMKARLQESGVMPKPE